MRAAVMGREVRTPIPLTTATCYGFSRRSPDVLRPEQRQGIRVVAVLGWESPRGSITVGDVFTNLRKVRGEWTLTGRDGRTYTRVPGSVLQVLEEAK